VLCFGFRVHLTKTIFYIYSTYPHTLLASQALPPHTLNPKPLTLKPKS